MSGAVAASEAERADACGKLVASLRREWWERSVGASEHRAFTARGRRVSAAAPASLEFAIRISAVDELFVPLDARPVAQRPLQEGVRLKLLDEWQRVRP